MGGCKRSSGQNDRLLDTARNSEDRGGKGKSHSCIINYDGKKDTEVLISDKPVPFGYQFKDTASSFYFPFPTPFADLDEPDFIVEVRLTP